MTALSQTRAQGSRLALDRGIQWTHFPDVVTPGAEQPSSSSAQEAPGVSVSGGTSQAAAAGEELTLPREEQPLLLKRDPGPEARGPPPAHAPHRDQVRNPKACLGSRLQGWGAGGPRERVT